MSLNNSNYDEQIDDENDSIKGSGDDTSRIEAVFSDMIGNQVTFLPTLQNIFMKVTKVQLYVDIIVIYPSYPKRQARSWISIMATRGQPVYQFLLGNFQFAEINPMKTWGV